MNNQKFIFAYVPSEAAGITDFLSPAAAQKKNPQAFARMYEEMTRLIKREQQPKQGRLL